MGRRWRIRSNVVARSSSFSRFINIGLARCARCARATNNESQFGFDLKFKFRFKFESSFGFAYEREREREFVFLSVAFVQFLARCLAWLQSPIVRVKVCSPSVQKSHEFWFALDEGAKKERF